MNTVNWTGGAEFAKSDVVNDGSVDKKGRKVGHYAVIEPRFAWLRSIALNFDGSIHDPSVRNEGSNKWSHNEEGPLAHLGFDVEIYPTRDGKHFSSCSRQGTRVASFEAAKALGEKKLAAYVRKVEKAKAAPVALMSRFAVGGAS